MSLKPVSIDRAKFESFMAQDDEGRNFNGNLESSARSVLRKFNEQLPEESRISYDALRRGENAPASILEGMGYGVYGNLLPSQRQFTDEAILGVFSDVEDFGNYSPENLATTLLRGTSGKVSAGARGTVQAAPESIAGALGAAAGWRAAPALLGVGRAALTALSFTPTPVGIGLRMALMLGTALAGTMAGAGVGRKGKEALFGEQKAVIPSLKSAEAFGEAAAMIGGFAATPIALARIPAKAEDALSAVQLLERFRSIAKTPQAGQIADDGIRILSRGAGVPPKLVDEALKARDKVAAMSSMAVPTSLKGARETLKAGSQRLKDPRKGPLTLRALAALERGGTELVKRAGDRPGRFLAKEGLLYGTLGGVGAMGAQELDPYDLSSRFVGELSTTVGTPILAAKAVNALVDKFVPGAASLAGRAFQKGRELLTEEGKAEAKKAAQREALFVEAKTAKLDERLRAAMEKILEGKVDPETGVADLGDVLESFDEALKSLRADPDLTPDVLQILNQIEANTKSPEIVKALKTVEMTLRGTVGSLESGTTAARNADKENAVQLVKVLKDLEEAGEDTGLNKAGNVLTELFEETIEEGFADNLKRANEAITRVYQGALDPAEMSKELSNITNKYLTTANVVLKKLGDLEVELYNAAVPDRKKVITRFFGENLDGEAFDTPNVVRVFEIDPEKKSSDFPEGGLDYFTSTRDRFRTFWNKSGVSEDLAALGVESPTQRKNPPDPATVDPPVAYTVERFIELRKNIRNAIAIQMRKVDADNQLIRDLRKLDNAVLADIASGFEKTDSYNAARGFTAAKKRFEESLGLNNLDTKDLTVALNPQKTLAQSLEDRREATTNFLRFLEDYNGPETPFPNKDIAIEALEDVKNLLRAQNKGGDDAVERALENTEETLESLTERAARAALFTAGNKLNLFKKITVSPRGGAEEVFVFDEKAYADVLRQAKSGQAGEAQVVLQYLGIDEALSDPQVTRLEAAFNALKDAQKQLTNKRPGPPSRNTEEYKELFEIFEGDVTFKALTDQRESAQQVVIKAANSANPETELKRILDTIERARKLKPEVFTEADELLAKEQIRVALLNPKQLIDNLDAGDRKTAVKLKTALTTKFKQSGKEESTPLQWLVNNKLMSEGESEVLLSNLNKIQKIADEIPTQELDETAAILFSSPGAQTEFLAKMFGAIGGNVLLKTVTSNLEKVLGVVLPKNAAALATGSWGVKQVEKIMLDGPARVEAQLYSRLLEDPESFSKILKVAENKKEAKIFLDAWDKIFGVLPGMGRGLSRPAFQDVIDRSERNAATTARIPVEQAQVPVRPPAPPVAPPVAPPPVQQIEQAPGQLSPRSRAILEQELAQDTIGNLLR